MLPVTIRRIFFLAVLISMMFVFLGRAGAQTEIDGRFAALSPPDPLTAKISPFSGALLAQFFPEPSLSESEAKDIASRFPDIAPLLERHPELEGQAGYNSTRGIWTVFWTHPGSGRQLITAEVSDSAGALLSRNIEEDTYLDIIPYLSKQDAIDLAGEQRRVQDEIKEKDIDPRAVFGTDMIWTVSFFEGQNEVAQVLIEDAPGTVREVRIGPQVAWQMARGYKGAFGRVVNEPYVWLPLCVLFLLPFVNIRRPLKMVHLDLLVLLSFTFSHYFFNRGEIFTSVPMAYPPLAYLLVRMAFIALRRVRRHGAEMGVTDNRDLEENSQENTVDVAMPHLNFRPRFLVVGLFILIVFRLVINFADSNVVDVGYSGVIGAHRILEGQTPYGNMPLDNAYGDTYGPLNYLVYVPFEKVFPWSGSWDSLPAAHAAAIFFDFLTVAGMFLAGRQLMRNRPAEGNRLGLALAYGWVAYPYTTFVLNSNVNDTVMAAFLVWGFVFLSKAPLAGALLGFATQIKFVPAILGPLWASFPRAFRGWSRRVLFVLGFAAAVAVTLPVIFLGDGTLNTFWERTVKWQISRDSPFSIWGQYPDRLAGTQRLGQYLVVALALASYVWPPRKTMVQMAAASAALILGFEIVQTHWFYLYIPWFFPLALIAVLARDGERGKMARRRGIGATG